MTCARIGPLATVVNGTSTGKSSSTDRISIDLMIVANARVVSNRAKCSPMHDREPPANGMNCQRSRALAASGLNRSIVWFGFSAFPGVVRSVPLPATG